MKIKEFFKKHKKLWLSIVDIMFTIMVFFLGLFLGLSITENNTASAEGYYPEDPYEYHYRLPIYFTNIVGLRSDDDVSLPIQNTFYSDALDTVFPFTTNIEYPDNYFSLSQTFNYLGFVDDYLRYSTTVELSSFSGNGFMLVAEDFWFSPEYDFKFKLEQFGVNPSFSAHYVVNYKDADFREKLVSFDESSSLHDITDLINDNVNDTTYIFYIRRLEVVVQNVNIQFIKLLFEFNGFDNDSYDDVTSMGVSLSNATVEVKRVDWFGSTVDSINSFLNIQIVPSYTTEGGKTIPAFTIGNVLAFCIIIPLIIAVLRLWLGG